MATKYFRPDVYIEEVSTATRPISGVSTAVTGFIGIAERGPVAKPVYIGGMGDFTRTFGAAQEGQALYYAVKGFFDNGGSQAYVVRQAHYSDITDATSVVANASAVSFDGTGDASFAVHSGGTDVSGVDMRDVLDIADPAQLSLDVNSAGAVNAEFTATAAVLTGGAYSLGGGIIAAPQTMTVSIDGGSNQVINLVATDDATAASILAKIGSQLAGANVSDGGAALSITSDTRGTSSGVQVVSVSDATVATALGFTAASEGNSAAVATSSMADASATTFTEIKTVIEGAEADVSCTQGASNELKITVNSGTAGVANELVLALGTAELLTALGVTAATYNGEAATASSAFTFTAGWRSHESVGTYGDSLSMSIEDDPKYESQGAGSDLSSTASAGSDEVSLTSMKGIVVGSVLKFDDGGGTEEYVLVTNTNTAVSAGAVTHTVTLDEVLLNTFISGASSVSSVEHTVKVYSGETLLETWAQMSVNADADNYVNTVLNDEEVGSSYLVATDIGLTFPANVLAEEGTPQALAGGSSELVDFADTDIVGDEDAKTGIYALDELQDLNLITIPPSFGDMTTIAASSLIHNQALAYAEDRMDCFVVLDAPDNMSPSQVKDYRNNTLGADSAWGALYYPNIQVADPLGNGQKPTVYIPASGHICGIYARVDNISPPQGGVASAPAGVGEFGKVRGVIGLRYYVSDKEHDTINPDGINVIRQFTRGGPTAPGIVVFGARTLSTVLEWRYIQVRRLMTFIEQSIRLGSRFAIFRNNDFRLWGQLSDLIKSFLRGLHLNGQLTGDSAEQAYFVTIDETTTKADDILNGTLKGEIGVSPQRPAEFIVFKFSQFQAGSTITE
jgi:phage tail sheath protein FI